MMSIAEKLQLLATWRGAKPNAPAGALWDIKHGVLSLLNDIDRELHYGNPGAGLDERLGTKDRPINIREAA